MRWRSGSNPTATIDIDIGILRRGARRLRIGKDNSIIIEHDPFFEVWMQNMSNIMATMDRGALMRDKGDEIILGRAAIFERV